MSVDSIVVSDQADRLTTIDNPYNPFTDFYHWFIFDVSKGYNTCGLTARVAQTSEMNSDQENNEIINEAITRILKFDFEGIYKRVKPPTL